MTHTPGRLLRTLVVEDDEDTASLLAEVIETWGHLARTATDGASALEICREFEPDVVLLDLGLPGIDGYTIAARLREQAEGRRFMLIALTGYQADHRRLRQSGFDRHLLKPPDLDALSQWLRDEAAAAE